MSKVTLIVCTLVAVAVASSAHAVVVTKSIHDLSGKSHLDGAVDGIGIGMNPGFVIGTPGSGPSGAFSASVPFYHASKFDLTGFPDLIGSSVNSASLIIPDQGTIRNGTPSGQDLIAEHFEAQSTTTIVAGDGTVAALTNLGTVIPTGGTGNAGSASTVMVDVTAQVTADLEAGRGLSSFRIGHDPDGEQPDVGTILIYKINDSSSGDNTAQNEATSLTIEYTIP